MLDNLQVCSNTSTNTNINVNFNVADVVRELGFDKQNLPVIVLYVSGAVCFIAYINCRYGKIEKVT